MKRDRPFLAGLAAIAIAGFGIRVWFIVWDAGRFDHLGPSFSSLRGDAFLYYKEAEALRNGHPFIAVLQSIEFHRILPDATHPPGFTVFLALLRYIGIDTVSSQRYAVAALGALTIVVVGLLGREFSGKRAGLIAAVIAATYPQVWINNGLLLSETMFVFGFALGTLFVYRCRRTARVSAMLYASIGYTIAASARPESILLAVLVIVPVIFGRWRHTPTKLVAHAALASLPFLAVFVPWAIFNSSRMEHPVLLSTGFGQTVRQGNCGATYYGAMLGYFSITCTSAHPAPVPPGAGVADQTVANSYYLNQAIRYAREHKSRLPVVVVAREGRLWGVFRPSQQASLDHYVEGRGPLGLMQVAMVTYWIVGAFAIAGYVTSRKKKRMVYPLIAEILLTAAVAAITFGNTRYRAGVEICLVIFAAAFFDDAWNWVMTKRRASDGGSPVTSDV